jgi:hypothetical protein
VHKVARVHYGGTCMSQSYRKLLYWEEREQENNEGGERMVSHEK